MRPSRLLLPALCLASGALAARADELVHLVELPDATTNWQASLALPRFDPALGVLQSVELSVEGRVLGSVAFESQDARASLVSVDFRARLEIDRPGGGTWIALEPNLQRSESLSAFDGAVDFAGSSGRTLAGLFASASDALSVPPPPEDLELFVGPEGAPGELVLDARASGLTTASGAGNLVLSVQTMAGASVRLAYEFSPAPGSCVEHDRRRPASLLVYPEFDNRLGDLTLLTVSNVGCDEDDAVDVHFVYVAEESCLEFDRVHRLTPCDTLSVLTTRDAPDAVRGYVYAYARDAAGRAISANRLIGNQLVIRGLESVEYSVNPFAFASPLPEGELTDLDQDGVRDLDGLEYVPAPDRLLVPRFLGQRSVDPTLGAPAQHGSQLVLIDVTRGGGFEVVVDYGIFNDAEEAFSAQSTFRCWTKRPLAAISGAFLQQFLAGTADAPDEILGASMQEAGWFWFEGRSASSSATTLERPAILGYLIEELNGRMAADLPFERCSRLGGALLPQGPF